jgi:hypothetical protein
MPTRRFLFALGGVGLAGLVALRVTRPAAVPPAPPRASPSLRLEQNPATVFERAFWRRLGPDVRVLGAERHEWLDAAQRPRRWAWFISLHSTPEFRAWLLETNPFELVRSSEPAAPESPPPWFPPAEDRTHFVAYRSRNGGLHVLVESATGRLCAWDHGGGFVPAQRSIASH